VPVINIDFTDVEHELRLEMIPKGSGSENGSFLQMLIPADGVAAVKRFVVDRVIQAGGKVCPPTIVGVGVGGTSDLCMHLAKVAATLAAAHVVVHQQAATPVVATISHLTKSLSRLSIFYQSHLP
jgi:fumarate hydratase subunit alpha/L(+)-tartrate dehydratase alpha subunit